MGKIISYLKGVYTEGDNENFLKEDAALVGILFADPINIPLARFLSRFKRVHPNHVTLFSIPLAIIAAYMFLTGRLALGALFFWLNFMIDGTDGKLARLTGKTSDYGEKLDYYTDTANNLMMYFGLWWSQYYLQGEWFIGGSIVFAHYAIMIFGYTLIGDFRYKTIIPRAGSYYSPFEEAFGTFLFAPLLNAVRIIFPILVGLQFISYITLFARQEEKSDMNELRTRIKNMLKLS